MNILHQTSQRLVIGTPARALWLVRLLGLAISFPGLLVLAIYGFSGAPDYASLNCRRDRPVERQCRFLRLSPVRPFLHRFPIEAIQAVNLQTQPPRSPSRAQDAAYRLEIHLTERRFPLSMAYSSRRQRQIAQQTQIQDFVANPALPSLVIRDWPSFWGLLVALVFFIPTLPLSLLMIGLAATPIIVSFDKTQQQITVSKKLIFGHEHKRCSFEDLDRIFVERTLVGQPRQSRQPTWRYTLFMVSKSGDQLLKYDYFEAAPAADIANTMQQFIVEDS
jgi:hypothetical protein